MNAIEIKHVDSLKEREMVLDRLLASDGWKAFEAAIRADLAAATKAMHQSPTGHDLAKHFGAHYALAHMLTWPEREMSLIRKQIEAAYNMAARPRP